MFVKSLLKRCIFGILSIFADLPISVAEHDLLLTNPLSYQIERCYRVKFLNRIQRVEEAPRHFANMAALHNNTKICPGEEMLKVC